MSRFITRPPQEQFLITHRGVEIFLFDATHGHKRHGWNHHQDRYCVVQYDPALPVDLGLVGSNLEDILLETKRDIQQRKKVRLN